ncbi:MAG: ABC transporter ATP-binding protein [Chloroflexi bacterium]|nr:ABC transporter ATP-binding protein [Chloroflexota bacterium]
MRAGDFQGASLRVERITKRFGGREVLCDISLEIPAGEIVGLLGPSGCGKTTLLRIIAGLETPDEGEVNLNSQRITDQPVHERGFGLMFQDHALFPHLSVADNVAFGLKMRGVAAQAITPRVEELLELVELSGAGKRSPATLSGGEKQRVALARSLAPNPPLLMLDEPLGSLDRVLRERLMVDLRRIIKQVGLTAIYVTHDRQEAFVTADRIAVMNAGRIEQIAAPQDLYRRPATQFVAQFIGLQNLYPVLSHHDGVAETSAGSLPVAGSPKTILIHPGGVRLFDFAKDGGLTRRATLSTVRFGGETYTIEAKLESGAPIVFDHPAFNGAPPEPGAIVQLEIDRGAVIGLD